MEKIRILSDYRLERAKQDLEAAKINFENERVRGRFVYHYSPVIKRPFVIGKHRNMAYYISKMTMK